MYALITGASSGIGREIAILLAKKGYNLILVARREERLKKLKEKLEEKYSITVQCAACDLSKREACISLWESCRNEKITVVVNGAGFGKVGEFRDVALDTELSMIDTNITAVHILTKLFARTMKKGHILNISSIAAFQPGPWLSTYSATKAYVASLSNAVNYEMKRLGRPVCVSCLCPGPVRTEFDAVAGTRFSMKSISAKECASYAVSGMFKRKPVIIPSPVTKAAYIGSKLAPLSIILPVEYEIQTRKLKKRDKV